MNEIFKSIVLNRTGATALTSIEVIQNLWSGYGKIMRIGLENSDTKSVVAKHVQLPKTKTILEDGTQILAIKEKSSPIKLKQIGIKTIAKIVLHGCPNVCQ